MFSLRILFSLMSFSVCTSVDSSPNKRYIPSELNDMLQLTLPALNQILQESFPASYGKCDEMSPDPCMKTEEELMVYTKSIMKASVNWIGGLNTINVLSASVSSVNEDTISLTISVTIDELPIQLQISLCTGEDTSSCFDLLNDSKTCCGNEKKTFDIEFTIPCSEHDNVPHLSQPSLASMKITPDIHLRPWGTFKLITITNRITSAVKLAMSTLITDEMILHLNEIVFPMLGPGSFTCSALSDASTP